MTTSGGAQGSFAKGSGGIDWSWLCSWKLKPAASLKSRTSGLAGRKLSGTCGTKVMLCAGPLHPNRARTARGEPDRSSC